MLANAQQITPNRSVFFFFQAEDGIRVYKVTGVQTCALPISRLCDSRERRATGLAEPERAAAARPYRQRPPPTQREIGRASCRERVQSRGYVDLTKRMIS